MESSTQIAPVASSPDNPSAKRAHVTYQAVTVAAILLLLGSLWVF